MKQVYQKKTVKTYRDLNVYEASFRLAGEVFRLSRTFPPDERYSLTDQIRRAARSIPANIAEGWAKRNYINVFRRHLLDASGSCEETKVWLDVAFDCGYISDAVRAQWIVAYDKVGAMLNALVEKWKSF